MVGVAETRGLTEDCDFAVELWERVDRSEGGMRSVCRISLVLAISICEETSKAGYLSLGRDTVTADDRSFGIVSSSFR
ncbi:hypothetical protein CKA32_001042 [Geitlerinema sp. FC II]|nr:hypothetical protein CKA32_001042 [Geitlerinema sp. FC II]